MAAKGLAAQACRLALCRSSLGRQSREVVCVAGARQLSVNQGGLTSTTTTTVTSNHLPPHSRTFLSKAWFSSSHYDKWTDLTYEDLVALLDSGDIQLFDVREQKEIEESGSIPRSVNIPLGSVKEALKMDDSRFTDQFKVPKPALHDTNIVFYGMGPIKSSAALELAHKIGYKKARHYVGGFEEWSTKQQQK